MAGQHANNFKIAFKVQTAKGTLASGAGATGLLVRPSQGMVRNVALAQSQLVTPDGMARKPRHGSVSVPAAYETELIVDALDDVFQAITRGTWTASADITQATASLTSAAISGTGTTVTAGGGSWITAGVRAGMMAKFTSMSDATNNGVWFPIASVTSATVFTVPSGYLTDQAADTAFTLTLARQVIQADPPTERYFTFEEYLQDTGVDVSLVGQDLKFGSITVSAAPDQPVMVSFSLMGIDADLLATGSSPTFSSPTFTSATPLYMADGALYLNGTAFANFTGFSFTIDMQAATTPVAGSRLSPDVSLNNAILSGSFTGIIEDDTYLNMSMNETQLSAFMLCNERESDPSDFVSFFLGNLSLGSFSKQLGGSGLMLQSFPLIGGKDERGASSGYFPSQVVISTSAT